MKKSLKLISFFLIMLMILPGILISCGGNDPGSSDKSKNDGAGGNQDAQGDPENTATEKITYDVPEMDCGGYEFKAIVREGWTIYWYCVDVFAEAENGEPVNDAVYRRNRMLEDKFNINISEIRQSDVSGFSEKLIKSGSDDFDVMFPTLTGAGAMIQQGYLLNLYNVPYLDFDKPWWNKTANDSLTSGHKLYAGVGNITTMTNDATWVCLFNKEIVRDMGLPDHYQMVKDGKWTIDILHENAIKATKDLNGDGELTPEDQWGAIGQYESSYCLFAASGQFIVEKDENDYPSLVLNNDRTIYALDKVIDLMTDKTCYINADDYTSKYENVWIDITTNAFAESRCLYLITNIEIVKNLRSMEANFGILPLPKSDETQEKYYNTMQYGNASCMALPVTASNLERTGAIVEAWAAESVDTLTRAYYDINLKSKNARDNESEEMLDLIFSTRVIDQGMFFNWAGLYDFFNSFVRAKRVEFGSQYEKSEPKWIKAIEKTIEAIEENNN
ncbi:MAG: hypothetical protein FWD23_06755 [Oscillospiraceae bacterium]|nr:hypothetical protein [Oscillospiraceae bacterium]